MTTDLQTQFSTRDGEQSYGRAISELIRAEQHDLAEETLMTDLALLRVPLAELCLETRTDLVRLTHWDTLQQFIFRPTIRRNLCTAVGLNLSNYSAPPQATPELFVEPDVEVCFYADEDFPFSTKSREEILAVNTSYPVPWMGAGSGVPPFYSMHVIGLARLNSGVELDQAYLWQNARRPPTPPDYIALRLAEWVRALRYHRAVKRHLEQDGLARHLPVIVGRHDVGPFLEAVYYPAPSRESAQEAEARMIAAREAQYRAARAEKESKLWEFAEGTREMRKTLRETRFWQSERRRKLREYYEAKEAGVFSRLKILGLLDQVGPLPTRSSWRIEDDEEFEQFLKRFYVDAFLTND